MMLPPAQVFEWIPAFESRMMLVCDLTPASRKTCWPEADFSTSMMRRVTPFEVPVDTTWIVPLPVEAVTALHQPPGPAAAGPIVSCETGTRHGAALLSGVTPL